MLIERWRTMDIAERALLVEQLCLDVEQLARAGIYALHPDYSEVEICHDVVREETTQRARAEDVGRSPESAGGFDDAGAYGSPRCQCF